MLLHCFCCLSESQCVQSAVTQGLFTTSHYHHLFITSHYHHHAAVHHAAVTAAAVSPPQLTNAPRASTPALAAGRHRGGGGGVCDQRKYDMPISSIPRTPRTPRRSCSRPRSRSSASSRGSETVGAQFQRIVGQAHLANVGVMASLNTPGTCCPGWARRRSCSTSSTCSHDPVLSLRNPGCLEVTLFLWLLS